MKGTAGTWFAIIGGGLLIYLLAQAMSNSGSMVSNVVTVGLPPQ